MALATATVTANLADMLGTDFDTRRTKVWITTNVADETVIDTVGNKIRLGSGTVTLNDDGTASMAVWVPGTGANPTSWQTSVHVDYPDPGTRTRKVRVFGPFTITTNADLADLVDEQEVPPTYLSTVTALLDGYVSEAHGFATEAEAARDAAVAISGLTGEDAAVGALVAGTGGAGPLTRAALSASIVAALGGDGAGYTLGEGYDVILLAGQSNMTGQGTTIDTVNFEVTDPRVKQFPTTGANVGKVITAQDPLLHQDSGNVGHAMAFARLLARYVAPNRTILLVPAARSASGFTTTSAGSPPAGFYTVAGTNMGSWDPAGGSGGFDLYAAAIAQANAAMAQEIAPGTTNRFLGIMWHQGEADGTLTQSQYAAKLDALIDGFRAGITGATAATPFILGQLLPENIAAIPARAVTNLAHVDTPRRKTRTGFYYGALGGGMPDNVHYAAAGQRLLGRAAFEAWQIALANVLGVAPAAPTAVTIVQVGTTATVSWLRPKGRATDYTIRYRVNAGSWTALTRAQSIDKSAAITGLTLGDALDVQVATVNEQGTSAWSATASLTLATVPGQVTGLTAATPAGSSMALTWTAVAGATSYLMEYKTHASGTWLTGPTVTTNAGTVTGLAFSTSYDFRVSALNAAGTGTVSSTTTASTTVPAPLLSDVGVSAYRAYGLRKQRAGQTNCIKVRRSSDNTTQVIGFTAGTNDLDTAAMLTFCGAGDGFIDTWYDQSGNGYDLVQTTTANQPKIVSAGAVITDNSKPAATFGGTPFFDDASHIGIYAAGAMSTLALVKASSGTLQGIWSEGKPSANGRNVVYAGTSGLLSENITNDSSVAVVGASGAAAANAALAQLSLVDTGSAISTWVNAVVGVSAQTYARVGTLTLTDFSLGKIYLGGATPGSGWLGNITEVVIFTAALTTAQRQAGEANQKLYYSTP